MTAPTPAPVPSSTKRADARQQVFVGFGMVCLACLMFQVAIRNMIASTEAASSAPSPSAVDDAPPMVSGAGLSKAQMETILSSIAELSDLLKERIASLHENLDRITWTFGRKNHEVSGADLGAIVGIFASALWFVGVLVITDGLSTISTTLRNRVWVGGLVGANVGLAYLLANPVSEHWLSYFTWTLWPMHLGVVGGLLFDRETFLA